MGRNPTVGDETNLLTEVQQRRSAILKGIEDLPPFPEVATKVLELSRDDNAGAADFARAISRDPALTASVIRAGNSAAMAAQREIDTLPDAIMRLGMRFVRDIVVSQCLPAVQRGGSHPVMKQLWVRSISSALTMRALGMTTRQADPEVHFLAGLFHDLGRQQLLLAFPREYGVLAKDHSAEGADFERRFFGLDHTEVGGAILENWQFDDVLCQVARCHHQDPEVLDPLSLHAAAVDELLDSELWSSTVEEIPEPELEAPGPAFKRLHLSQEDLGSFLRRTQAAVEREIQYFQMAA